LKVALYLQEIRLVHMNYCFLPLEMAAYKPLVVSPTQKSQGE